MGGVGLHYVGCGHDLFEAGADYAEDWAHFLAFFVVSLELLLVVDVEAVAGEGQALPGFHVEVEGGFTGSAGSLEG